MFQCFGSKRGEEEGLSHGDTAQGGVKTSGRLLDWLLVVLVLFAVEDFDAALFGSWTTGQAAGGADNTRHESPDGSTVVS